MSAWQCPDGIAHLYEVSIDPNCVDTIQRLTAEPTRNPPEVLSAAAEAVMTTGEHYNVNPFPGELIRVACSKCGRPAYVGIGWKERA